MSLFDSLVSAVIKADKDYVPEEKKENPELPSVIDTVKPRAEPESEILKNEIEELKKKLETAQAENRKLAAHTSLARPQTVSQILREQDYHPLYGGK